MDDEITHILAGWAAVCIGLAGMIAGGVFGSVLVGLLWTLVLSAGILVLVYAFVRFRVPEIIKFFKHIKEKGVVSSIQSLGL